MNGRKGLYHDLLPQPSLQDEIETAAGEAEPEPQEDGTRKHHSKQKSKTKQKTVILSSPGG
eukprot:COSAG03_NODE_2184_length_3033_cov_1.748807_1_plen_60_part_10